MEPTEKVRLWRYADDTQEGSWRTGPTPAATDRPIEFAWALLAPEPTEATGRPPGSPDQAVGFCEGMRAHLDLRPPALTGDGDWSACLDWGPVAEARGDTAVEAIDRALRDAWEQTEHRRELSG